MKYLAFLLLGVTLVSCGPSSFDAAEYNDKIINKQIEIITSVTDLSNEFGSYDNDGIDAQYKKTVKLVEDTKKFTNELEGFDGKTDFKDAFMDLLNVIDGQLKKEYLVLMEILKIPTEEYTEEDEAQYMEVATKADEEFEKAQDDFIQAQKDFAAKYNFILQ